MTDEELAKLGLERPPPRALPGQHPVPAQPIPPVQAPAAANPPFLAAHQYRYRYPVPARRPGISLADYQVEIARVLGHNALLDGVGGDWNAYIAELGRVRRAIAQGDQFNRVGEDAARMFAVYHLNHPERPGMAPLPAPIPMFVPQGPQALPIVPPPNQYLPSLRHLLPCLQLLQLLRYRHPEQGGSERRPELNRSLAFSAVIIVQTALLQMQHLLKYF